MIYLPDWMKAKMLPLPSGKYIAGISGGADSTALLHLLADRTAFPDITVEAVHINHGLRGAESDGDEIFVRELCSRLQINVHIFHADLHGRQDENSARQARFLFFRKAMEETGAEALVLAHHADDVAETFLMRLIRGAGTEGLSCMQAADTLDSIPIFRPMLHFTREEIRRALQESRIEWREDSSNSNTAYLRNNIRANILPRLESLNPGVAMRIANASRIISEDNQALNDISQSFLRKNSGKRWIYRKELKDMPEGLQRRILRMWWKQNVPLPEEHALSTSQTEQLVSLLSGDHHKINLPGSLHAVKGKHAIHITGFPPNVLTDVPFEGKAVDCGDIRMNVVPGMNTPGNGKTEQEFPLPFLQGCTIRSRKPGDWISPFGMSGKKKLQDYFVDRGIDEPWRDEIPLICRGQEVIFAAGIGTGHIPSWDSRSENIRIQWSGEMPWINYGSNNNKEEY